MLSVCLLIARIMAPWKKVWIAHGVAVTIGLWAVVSILVSALSCKLPHPWLITRPRHCINLVGVGAGHEYVQPLMSLTKWAMYTTIEIVKIALELANILTAVALIWSLQMPLRPRLMVLAAFAIRLLYVPSTIFLFTCRLKRKPHQRHPAISLTPPLQPHRPRQPRLELLTRRRRHHHPGRPAPQHHPRDHPVRETLPDSLPPQQRTHPRARTYTYVSSPSCTDGSRPQQDTLSRVPIAEAGKDTWQAGDLADSRASGSSCDSHHNRA